MGERNWSLSVLADKSLLLWAVIGIIFPFKVGTEMHFAEISCESLHAGRLIFPQDRMWIIYPTFSTMLPALSLTCTHSLTPTKPRQQTWPGFQNKSSKMTLIYLCSEHAPLALGIMWVLVSKETTGMLSTSSAILHCRTLWGFFFPPSENLLKTSIWNNLPHLIGVDFYLQICNSSQE